MYPLIYSGECLGGRIVGNITADIVKRYVKEQWVKEGKED
jgi:hypothetical protein